MARVFIGVDPHKLSATIEMVDDREKVLAIGRFATDKAGYAAMRRHVAAGPGLGGRGQQRRRSTAGPTAFDERRARARDAALVAACGSMPVTRHDDRSGPRRRPQRFPLLDDLTGVPGLVGLPPLTVT
jgi:hypothetical protein